MTTDRDLARWRLRTQHLSAPHAASAAAVVSHLLAVQAENPDQARWAVACRTARPDPADLAGLLDDGAVLRTHVLRPTWHFVAAADLGWLLELTAPRVRPVFERQLTEHGWSVPDLDRATAGVVETLAETPDRTRDQLRAALAERGVTAAGQALMLLLGLAEIDRLICSGRAVAGAQHTYALVADRVPAAAPFDRERALADLAERYFTGHGPATDRDLAYWATLSLGDVRRGIEGARDRLGSTVHEGRTFWHAAGAAPPAGPQEPAGHLLQILDETYRGYQDSRMVLDAEGVVPRGRETAIGMAVVDAQMVARMKRRVGARVCFELTPYRPLRAAEVDALEAAAARYGAFLGLEHALEVAG